MPNAIERQSLKTSLSTRYSGQKAGGAFDAKNIATQPGQRGSEGGLGFGLQEVRYTVPMFRIASWAFLQQSDFKNDGNNLSAFVKGLDTTRYKGTI